MSWYYAREGKQVGPVSEEEFQNLRGTGGVTGETLVWREGMANWQPCAEVFAADDAATPPAGAPPPPTKLATAGVVCTSCGGTFPLDEVVRLGDGFVCAACKPLAVQRMREGVASNEAEEIRNEHIKHEASIKSVAVLYLIGAILLFISGGMFLFAGTSMRPPPSSGGESVVFFGTFGAVMFALGALQFAVAIGIRRLKSWARVVGGILSGIGLIVGFPVGTIVNAYILYLLFSAKGKMVFSEEYQDIITQTPHIKYRTSVIVWIFLGILLFLLIFGVISVVLGTIR